jgi:hypothetical protein
MDSPISINSVYPYGRRRRTGTKVTTGEEIQVEVYACAFVVIMKQKYNYYRIILKEIKKNTNSLGFVTMHANFIN